MASVLLENARQIPPLQLSQAADERAGAVATEVAHGTEWIVLRRRGWEDYGWEDYEWENLR